MTPPLLRWSLKPQTLVIINKRKPCKPVLSTGRYAMSITRRRVLTTIACTSALAVPFLRPARVAAAEGTLETTSVTLAKNRALCTTPQLIAEELLRAEGFTEIRLVDVPIADHPAALGAGKIDFTVTYASQFLAGLDNGAPLTVLAGVMVGCYELFAHENVRTIGE